MAYVVFWHVLVCWIQVVFVRRLMEMIVWVLLVLVVVQVRVVEICAIVRVSCVLLVGHEDVRFVPLHQVVGFRLVGIVRILAIIERVVGRILVVWLSGLE